jgi:hypothetical protein
MEVWNLRGLTPSTWPDVWHGGSLYQTSCPRNVAAVRAAVKNSAAVRADIMNSGNSLVPAVWSVSVWCLLVAACGSCINYIADVRQMWRVEQHVDQLLRIACRSAVENSWSCCQISSWDTSLQNVTGVRPSLRCSKGDEKLPKTSPPATL